jgi:3-dehydroquinate synthetase
MSSVQVLKKNEVAAFLETLPSDHLLFIVDEKLKDLKNVFLDLENVNKKKSVFYCKSGEETKNFHELEKAIEFFLSQGIHRKCILVSFGGGATSDFSGLVASLLLRGISWVTIPTTFLAMIDAAIGGKVAINSKFGKNLIGHFYLPLNNILIPDFLTTLPQEELFNGMGELVKYAFLDIAIYQAILSGEPLHLIMKRCIDYKNKIVKKDLREEGDRKLLNLGHTFGHAFEIHLKIPHGQAVLKGLEFILKMDNKIELLESFYKLCEHLSLPLNKYNFPKFEVIKELVMRDKKVQNVDEIDWINIIEIGKPEIKRESIEAFLQRAEIVYGEYVKLHQGS